MDIGCGAASPLTALRGPDFRSTGIDVDPVAIARSRSIGAHDEYLLGDFRAMELGTQFDVIVLSHVIEHLERDEGMKVLGLLEVRAARLLYVETPHGFLEQLAGEECRWQRHLSGWFPNDFRARGYTVFGSGGIRGLRGSMGRAKILTEPVTRAIARATQWVVFRRPTLAGTIAAIRFRDGDGNIRAL